MKTIRAYILGTVQGVFFRSSVKSKANELGLKGYVRNLDDGRVEIVAEGRDENVDELLSYCKKGPSHAEVKNMEKEELGHQGFKDFKVMRL